jgi:uncharacterized protein (TIGR02001 family)
MKLSKISALCFAATSMFAASSAMAWESESGAWSTSASVALSSEYVFRGISQTGGTPALSGSFDVAHSSGFYAGTWASNIENDEGSLEIDYYAGFSGDIGDSGFSYDVGGLYYDFPEIEDFDYFETYAFLSYSFLSAGVSYSWELGDADWDGAEDNVYYQLDASHDFGPVALSAGVGYLDFDEDPVAGTDSYANYYIAASKDLAGFGFELKYTDTDSDAEDIYGDGPSDGAFIFTISKSL